MAGYEFDVFVSYHRGRRMVPGGDWPLSEEGLWVRDLFLPCFEHWLNHSLNRDAQVAFDGRLKPGVKWEDELQRMLKSSRCMVAIWSSPYFRSGYCRSEFHSMLERQHRFPGRDGNEVPLVIPLVYWDGQWFDDEAKAHQFSTNFSRFSKYKRPIANEDVHAEFVTAVQGLCQQVCDVLDNAPPHDPGFPWCRKDGLVPPDTYPSPSLR